MQRYVGEALLNDSQEKTLSSRAQFASAVFFSIGAFALVVGLRDAFQAAAFASRLFAVFLVAAGVALMIAFVSIVARRPWAYMASLIAGLGGTAFGVSLLLIQWNQYDRDWRLGLWSAITVACLVGAAAMAREGRLALTGLARRTLLIALSLASASLVAVTQLWQEAVYLPSKLSPHLTLMTSLEPIGRRRNLDVLKATIHVKNPGDLKVRAIGSFYSLVGERIQPARLAYGDFLTQIEKSALTEFAERPAVSRSYQPTEPTVLEFGELLPPTWYFDSDEEYSTTRTLYVPRGEHERVRLFVWLAVANGDALVLEDERPKPAIQDGKNGERWVVTVRNLEETSWLHELTRGDRFVLSYVQVGPKKKGAVESLPAFGAYIDREGRLSAKPGEDDYNKQMNKIYGLSSTFSTAELSTAVEEPVTSRRRRMDNPPREPRPARKTPEGGRGGDRC